MPAWGRSPNRRARFERSNSLFSPATGMHPVKPERQDRHGCNVFSAKDSFAKPTTGQVFWLPDQTTGCTFPQGVFPAVVCRSVRPRLQRRDRNGITPFSLFFSPGHKPRESPRSGPPRDTPSRKGGLILPPGIPIATHFPDDFPEPDPASCRARDRAIQWFRDKRFREKRLFALPRNRRRQRRLLRSIVARRGHLDGTSPADGALHPGTPVAVARLQREMTDPPAFGTRGERTLVRGNGWRGVGHNELRR
jgi:hypothetical protein